MRCKEKTFSKPRDETDDVVQLIQQSADDWSCTKEALTAKLMQLKSINEDTAKANIDCALCLGTVVLLHRGAGDKPILRDVTTLRRERSLCPKSLSNLEDVVLMTLNELGARSRASSCSPSEIVAHIRLTYDLKLKNSESFHAVVQRELDTLHKNNWISTTIGGPTAMSYYLAVTADKGVRETNDHYNGMKAEYLPSTSTVHLNGATEQRPSPKIKRNSRVAAKKDPPSGTSGGKSELRQLQDSLSQFFTPSSVRRSRLSLLGNMVAMDGGYRRSVEKPDIEESKPLNKVLEIVIDERGAELPVPLTTSSETSLRSAGGRTGSSTTTPSPHRRGDQLQDALSFYFSASSERRKRHEKGEYLVMSNGVTPRRKIDANEELPHPRIDTVKDEKEDIKVITAEPAIAQQRKISPTRSTTRSPKSPSAAVIKRRRASLRRLSVTTTIASGGVRKRAQLATRSSFFAKRKANKLLKNAKGAFCPTSSGELSTASNSPKKSFNNLFNGETVNRMKLSPIKSPHTSSFKAFNPNPPDLKHTESGWEIPNENRKMFDQARELAQKDLQKQMQMLAANNPNQAYPARIKISNYEIDAWYSSPYPQEYVMLPLVYICESCLTYLADEAPHARKCTAKFPPGNEVYRQNNISVFEVDGNLARVYCRNLCLLAKLFIDHKTLYFDVEPFLFYVLTINDERGNHFVGYFSKEKFSSQKYNLACIVTLPCYQGGGYGRFLIDFSYLLSRCENMLGTPERPLSELGRIAYQSYWRGAILEELYRSIMESTDKSLSINDISQRTGITLHDVLDTLLANQLLKVNNNAVCFSINMQQLKRHWDRAKNSKSRIWMDESCLRWSPKQYSPSKEFPLRSPTNAPVELTMIKEESSVVEKIKRRGRRKLFFEEAPEPVIGRQRKSSIKLNLRRSQMEEEFLSEDDDDIISPKLMSCKDDANPKSNSRKTPPTDDELPGGEKRLSGARSFQRNCADTSKTTVGRGPKSHRCYRGMTRRESKKPLVTDSSSSTDNDDGVKKIRDNKADVMELSEAPEPKLETNRIYSTTECEDNNSDSSAYGEPKRKNSGYQRRKQSSGIRGGKPRAAGLKGKRKVGVEKKPAASVKGVNSSNPPLVSVQDDKARPVVGHKKEKVMIKIVSSSSSSDESDSEKSIEPTPKIVEKLARKSPKKPHNRRRGSASRHNAARKCSNRYGSDAEDDICTASSVSSMSPQPLNDHHLMSMKNGNSHNEPDTINMGGEPDIINMGGEPDIINMGGEPDEDIVLMPTMMNAISPNSPKAPLAPPANVVVEEEEPAENYIQSDAGFFSHQTTSNRSAVGSSQASFEQASSHCNNTSADDFHAQSYQHVQPQQQEYDSGSFGQPAASKQAFHGSNYALYVPTTSSLAAAYASNNKFDVSPVTDSYASNGASYYSHQSQLQQQPPHGFVPAGGEEVKSMVDGYAPAQLQDMCGPLKVATDEKADLTMEDKGELDMPVLDARTTPRTSPSLVSMEQNMVDHLKPPNSDDEDDDDAPPQLSPNVPSNEVHPISPDGSITKGSVLLPPAMNMSGADDALDSSSIGNNSMANASYDSSKSSAHSLKGSDSAAEPQGTSQSPDANQFAGKFNTPALLQPQLPNFGAYNFQCGANQFSTAEFPTPGCVDSTQSPPTANELANGESGIMSAKSVDYEKDSNGGLYGSTAPKLPALLAPLNITPPNAGQAGSNGVLQRADVLSPQEQRSAPPNLLQCQSAVDLGMYVPQVSNPTVSGDAVKAAESNEIYLSISTGYLPSTLSVPQQQSRSSSATGVLKKSKRSTAKETKEKPTKMSKRVKSSENTAENNAAIAKTPAVMHNFPQFMNGTFTPDYMSMAAAQFAISNGSGSMAMANPLATMNAMPGGNSGAAGAYYSPSAAASAGYFNAAVMANGGYQYQSMNQSFYNNTAAWQQYYGFYGNNQYPTMPNGVGNSQQQQQQSTAFRTGTPDGGVPATIRGRSASTATPAVMSTAAQQPIDIGKQQRSISSGGTNAGTPLLSPAAGGWSPAMMAFGMAPGTPHAAAGSLPTGAYPMNIHPAYSSYTTHT